MSYIRTFDVVHELKNCTQGTKHVGFQIFPVSSVLSFDIELYWMGFANSLHKRRWARCILFWYSKLKYFTPERMSCFPVLSNSIFVLFPFKLHWLRFSNLPNSCGVKKRGWIDSTRWDINKLKLSWQLNITSNSIWTLKFLIIWIVNIVTELIEYFYVVFWKWDKRISEIIKSNLTPIEIVSINVHFSTINTVKRISGRNAQWTNPDRLKQLLGLCLAENDWASLTS